jgi:hypothetical protein
MYGGRAADRILVAELLAFDDRLVEHRDDDRRREPAAQVGIGLHRSGMDIGGKHHDRLDHAPPRLAEKADLGGKRKEPLERALAEIDDLGDAVVHDEAVEQGHLRASGAEVCLHRYVRQKIRERALARIEIEGADRAAVDAQEIGQEPR